MAPLSFCFNNRKRQNRHSNRRLGHKPRRTSIRLCLGRRTESCRFWPDCRHSHRHRRRTQRSCRRSSRRCCRKSHRTSSPMPLACRKSLGRNSRVSCSPWGKLAPFRQVQCKPRRRKPQVHRTQPLCLCNSRRIVRTDCRTCRCHLWISRRSCPCRSRRRTCRNRLGRSCKSRSGRRSCRRRRPRRRRKVRNLACNCHKFPPARRSYRRRKSRPAADNRRNLAGKSCKFPADRRRRRHTAHRKRRNLRHNWSNSPLHRTCRRRICHRCQCSLQSDC